MSRKIERLLADTEITATSTALQLSENASDLELKAPRLAWEEQMKFFMPSTLIGMPLLMGNFVAPSLISIYDKRGHVEPFLVNLGNFLTDYQIVTGSGFMIAVISIAFFSSRRNQKYQNFLWNRIRELKAVSQQMTQMQQPPVDVTQLPENVQQALELTMETIREYYETSEAYRNSVATFQVNKMTENLSRALNLYLDLSPKKRTAGSPITEELLEQLRAVDVQARTAIDETEKDKLSSFKEHSIYMQSITDTGITLK